MSFSLSDYTDLRELRRGGFARIFLAVQKSLGRQVIIKQLDRGDDAGLRKRFEKEARAAAALEHPNIVRVYDFGVQDDACCIVMEYVDGCDLEDLLRAAGVSVEVSLAALLQALRGLRHSHTLGVVHRDVKPANILVSRAGIAKIADFGLALAETASPVLTRSDFTRSGVMAGTPHYMSPEQMSGGPVRDRRIDVWAAGAVCYRILTGKLPFEGETLPALVYRIVHTRETPVRRLLPRLPEDLGVAIDRCLEKEPAGRPDSLDPLIAALGSHLEDRGITDPATFVGGCPVVSTGSAGDGGGPVDDGDVAPTRDAARATPPMPVPAYSRKAVPALVTVAVAVTIAGCIGAGLLWWRLRPPVAAARVTQRTPGSPPHLAPAAALAKAAVDSTRRPVHSPATGEPTVRARPARQPETVATSVRQSSPVEGRPDTPAVDTAVTASAIARQPAVVESVPRAPAAATPVGRPDVPVESGELLVQVFPLDAEVYADGILKSRGGSGKPLSLSAGTHTLLVKRQGYREHAQTVNVRAGTLTRLKVRLEK